MDSRFRTATLSLAAFTFLALGAAAPAQAQTMGDAPDWTVDARGGIAIPMGDVADLPIEDTGPALGLGVGYYLSPRLAVRGEGSAELYTGDFNTAPDVRFVHYNLGLEAQVTEPGQSPFAVIVNLGAGATAWDTDALGGSGGGPEEFRATYFTVNGGLKLGYNFASNATVFVAGDWYQQFTDEEETQRLARVSPDLDQGFDSASSVPLTLGFKFGL